MRDDGEELVLGAVGRLGLGARDFELALARDVRPGEGREIVFAARQRALQRLAARFDCEQVMRAQAQLVDGKRLHQIVLRTCTQQLDAHLAFGPRGQDEHRDRAELRPLPQYLQHVGAAHLRHHHVGHDEIGRLLHREVESRAAVGSRLHHVVAPERGGDIAAHIGVVFDDEDGGTLRRRRRRRRLHGRGDNRRQVRCMRGHGRTRLFCEGVGSNRDPVRRQSRQIDHEGGAAAARIAQGNPAAVQLDEVLDDRETQTSPLEAARRGLFDLKKALEYGVAELGRDARPGIPHDDADPAGVAARACGKPAGDLTAGRRELERVRQQVQHHPDNLVGIELGLERRRRGHVERDPALRCRLLEVGGRIADKPGGVDRDIVRLQPAGIEARDIQQIVDMPEQRARVPLNHLERRRPRIGDAGPRQHLLDWAKYQGQRRPQLVADVGKELCLQLVDSLQPIVQLRALERALGELGVRRPQLAIDVLEVLRAREDLGFHLLRAILEQLGPPRLLAILLLQPDERGHVLDAVDDVGDLAVRVAHRRIDGAPVALLEAAAFALRPADVILLDRHHVCAFRLAHPFERGAQIPRAGRGGIVRIVGKHVKEVAAENLFALGHRGAEIGVARGNNFQIGCEHQVQTGRRFEQGPEVGRSPIGVIEPPLDKAGIVSSVCIH